MSSCVAEHFDPQSVLIDWKDARGRGRCSDRRCRVRRDRQREDKRPRPASRSACQHALRSCQAGLSRSARLKGVALGDEVLRLVCPEEDGA